MAEIKTLFLDIGGVLVTNGWDAETRRAAAAEFNLDLDQLNERHELTFGTYELGKITLDEYLRRVVFYEKRAFGEEDFKAFIFARWRAYPEMWDFVKALKTRRSLQTVAVSNESREFTVRRVREFRLKDILDAFVVSGFVGLRKPDPDIYRLALDVAQTLPDRAVYIEDRAMFVDVAAGLGIHAIQHKDYETTRGELAKLGLELGG
jgi:putative hydrolase of the HAD superfamily